MSQMKLLGRRARSSLFHQVDVYISVTFMTSCGVLRPRFIVSTGLSWHFVSWKIMFCFFFSCFAVSMFIRWLPLLQNHLLLVPKQKPLCFFGSVQHSVFCTRWLCPRMVKTCTQAEWLLWKVANMLCGSGSWWHQSREIIIMEAAVLNYIALELQKLIIYYKATDCNSII